MVIILGRRNIRNCDRSRVAYVCVDGLYIGRGRFVDGSRDENYRNSRAANSELGFQRDVSRWTPNSVFIVCWD